MKDDISIRITCPRCGHTQKVERFVSMDDYLNDWDKALADFETEEFVCQCGERFLGAETVQSDTVAKVIEFAKELKAEGKFDISENGVKIKLGLSDIWKIIREFKDLKGDLL